MHRLVEDLLLLSRMEAHDRSVVPRPVDVAELLDTLTQRLRLVVSQRRLRLELELPERLLAAGDAGQLEHLFGNLLDNATKYSPEGGTITVRGGLEPGDPHGEHPERVSVAVHNTGSCIPPEALPHVFERFYRVDKSRSRSVAGSGLGLAIAREVAERHGGTIRAESDPATGTTFVVTLPAAPGTPAPQAPGPRPQVPGRGAVGDVGRGTSDFGRAGWRGSAARDAHGPSEWCDAHAPQARGGARVEGPRSPV
jgi:two-component system sensor histidine kinase VicK